MVLTAVRVLDVEKCIAGWVSIRREGVGQRQLCTQHMALVVTETLRVAWVFRSSAGQLYSAWKAATDAHLRS